MGIEADWPTPFLENHPNMYLQQIGEKLRVIDITEDAASFMRVAEGEATRLGSRLFADYITRKKFTDQ